MSEREDTQKGLEGGEEGQHPQIPPKMPYEDAYGGQESQNRKPTLSTESIPRVKLSDERVDTFFPKVIVCDLDGTITKQGATSYETSEPSTQMKAALAAARRRGWQIVIDTARGYCMSEQEREDIAELTRNQLDLWGIPYDHVRVGVKIAGALYIDDRSCTPQDFIDSVHGYKETIISI